LTALNLALHVTDQFGMPGEGERPILVASTFTGLALQNPGPGGVLGASLAYEWTWAHMQMGFRLRYLWTQNVSPGLDYMIERTSCAAGFTVGFGSWYPFGHREPRAHAGAD
jgi:hypothetical protein